MKQVEFQAGKNGSGLGAYWVWCQEALMGRSFSGAEDLYVAAALLCQSIEQRWHCPVVCSNVAALTVDQGEQAELISDDERIEVLAKPKRKSKRKFNAYNQIVSGLEDYE